VWSNKANKKFVVRQLKALRTIDILAGLGGFNFFYIVRDTEVAFYTSIMDNAINAVLFVPVV
jgi:hypothetical protein